MKTRIINFSVGFAVLVGLWWISSLHPKYSATVPTPIQVVGTFFSTKSLSLAAPTFFTFAVVLFSLIVSLVTGYAIGCLIGLSKIARTVFYFPASIFKSVPVSVFLPVFMTLFGLNGFVYPMLCIPVGAMVAVNVANAVSEMPHERVLQRRLLQLSLVSYLRDIVFWETIESFFATVRIAAPFCLTLQVALDYFLYTNDGLGAYIKKCYDTYSYSQMYAAILLVSLLGFAMLFATDTLSKRVQKWKIKKPN